MSPRPLRGLPAPSGRRVTGVGGELAAGGRVLPLAGERSLAVDGEAVRRRLGAWVATQPLAERPGIEAIWRDGLLVCDGVMALARALLGAPGAPLWLLDVPLPSDLHGLACAAGAPSRSVRRVVDALIAAEVLDGVRQIGTERVVRIRSEVLADAPVLAAVRWDVVGERLGEHDAPIARLVVRELARRTTPEARTQAHFVSVSQRDLAAAVGYSKASMRRHLDALVDAGVIASRSRDRANSWHRLQPVVFGDVVAARIGVMRPADGEMPSAAAGPPRLAVPRSRRRAEASAAQVSDALAVGRAAAEPAAPSSDLPSSGGGARPLEAALTVEVNGVRVAIPSGVALTLEEDAAGAIWYRAGSLRLGPVRFV